MICNKCGVQNDSNAVYCLSCGTPLNGSGLDQSGQNNVQGNVFQNNQNGFNMNNNQDVLNTNTDNGASDIMSFMPSTEPAAPAVDLMKPMDTNINNAPLQDNNTNSFVNNNAPMQDNNMNGFINNGVPMQNSSNEQSFQTNNQATNFSQPAMNINQQPQNQGSKIKPAYIIGGVAVILVIIGVILAFMFFRTKTVSCSFHNSLSDGLNVNMTVNTKFKHKKVNNVEMKMEYKLSSDYVNYIDKLYEQLDETYKSYDEKDGVDVKINKDDNKITITITADKNGLKSLNDINSSDLDVSYDEFIEEMEDANFSCKVK